jgi:hypothetical protein
VFLDLIFKDSPELNRCGQKRKSEIWSKT